MNRLGSPRCAFLLGLMLSGCYLRHGFTDGDAAIGRDASVDAAIRRDASVDASRDAAVRPRCCVRWVFERRLTIDAFDERTVTPRLVSLAGRPAVVVTGPSDSVGPSGAHLVVLEPDLTRYRRPVPVTRGSFTWGQPASAGDRFAVCWGGSPGDVARVYDSDGNPLTSQTTLAPMAASPCFGAAFLGDRFAFAFQEHAAAGRLSLVVRLVDSASGEAAERFEIPIVDESQDASLVATREGFAIAVPGDPARLFLIDTRARLVAERTVAAARAMRVVPSGDRGLAVVRIVDRLVDGGRLSGVWTYGLVTLPSLDPSTPPTDILMVEVAPALLFAADEGSCGEMLFAHQGGDLGVVRDPVRPRIEGWHSAPPAGDFVGDTSVLAMADATYVAFASVLPGAFDSVVSVDRWICVER